MSPSSSGDVVQFLHSIEPSLVGDWVPELLNMWLVGERSDLYDLIVEVLGSLLNDRDAELIEFVLNVSAKPCCNFEKDSPVIRGLSSRLGGLGPAKFAKTSEAINVS